MSKKANTTLIGAFVLSAIVLAIALVVILGSGKLFSRTKMHVMFFPDSVKGLSVGSAVMFRGVRIGQVTRMQVKFYEKELNILIPVFIEIDPGLIIMVNSGQTPEDLELLIKKGLRAQLQLQSFVTGQLVVDLDFYPDKPARLVGTETGYEEIPTIATPIQEITKTLGELPIKQILAKLDSTLAGIEQIANSPQIRESIKSLNQTLQSINRLVNSPNIEGSFDSLNQTIKKLDKILAQNENLGYMTNQALEDVSRMARSLHSLADYLDRHPEALIKGTGAGGKGE